MKLHYRVLECHHMIYLSKPEDTITFHETRDYVNHVIWIELKMVTIENKYKVALSHFRTSSHDLFVETEDTITFHETRNM